MDTTLKTLTNKEFIEALIVLFNSPHALSVIRLILFIIVLKLIYPLIYKIILDFFFEKPKRVLEEKKIEIQKQTLEIEKQQNTKLYKNQEVFIELFKKQYELVDNILKTLQISPSNHKYEILVESFLGIDRSFSNELKSKLLNYIDNKSNEKFIYVKKEVYNAFKDKVLNKLGLFAYADVEHLNKLYDTTKEILDNFLNKFVDIQDIDEAKNMLDDEKEGLVMVLTNLQEIIVFEYYSLFDADSFTDYLKRKNI